MAVIQAGRPRNVFVESQNQEIIATEQDTEWRIDLGDDTMTKVQDKLVEEPDRSVVAEFVEMARQRGCYITVEQVMNPPTTEEIEKKKKRFERKARAQGLKIMTDEKRAKLIRIAEEFDPKL